MSDQHEVYPADWAKVILMVSPTGEFHVVGGDREPGEGDMPYPGMERLKERIAVEKERVRGGVAGLRIPTMDDSTRLFIDCLHMLDLASAYEIAIRVLPGDHDDKSLLRGEFLPVIMALRVHVDALRGLLERVKPWMLDRLTPGAQSGLYDEVEAAVKDFRAVPAPHAPACDTCHSQPATLCTACLDSREHELRATLDRLRRAITRLEAERTHFVSGVVDAVASKGIETGTEVAELHDALARCYVTLNLRDPKDPLIPIIEAVLPVEKRREPT